MELLTDIIEESAARFGNRPAVAIRPRFRTISFTYAQLYQYALGVAAILDERGIQKGDRVLIWAPNSPYWIGAFFGCLLRGVMVVPLHLENTPQFIQGVSEQTEPRLLFKSSLFTLPEYTCPVLNIDTLEELAQQNPRGRIDPSTPLRVNPEPVEWVEKTDVSPDDAAQILYTSGTTGQPKGVILTHRNIVSNLRSTWNIIPVSRKDRVLSILPLSHIFEQIVEFRVLAEGAPISYTPALSSSIIRKLLKEKRITKMAAVPEVLKRIITRLETRAKEEGKEKLLASMLRLSAKIPLRSIRRMIFRKIHREFGNKLSLIVSGGAPLEEEVARKWHAIGIDVIQGYGLTETSPVVSTLKPGDTRLASVGKVIPGVKVKIAQDGEILVKGENVTPGYWKNPEKTKELFDEEGWMRTGDIGALDKEGYLSIRGRKKLMILTGSGQNVYPEDIETELNKESGVRDSAVVGLDDSRGTKIHAVLLGDIQNGDEIIARANKRLAAFQQIQGWSLWPLEDFPRTITRKVKHHEVLAFLKNRGTKDVGKTEGRGAPVLWRILADVSRIDLGRIGKETTIQDIGLDSLARVELTARIEEEFGVELDEAAILPETTVADLEDRTAQGAQKKERHTFKTWPLSPPILLLRGIAQRILLEPLVKRFTSPKIEGLSNLEHLELPALFFSNHLGSADAVLVISTLPRHIRKKLAIATATDVIFEDAQFQKYEGMLTFLANIYPFARKGQFKSGLEYTGRLIDEGFSILVFPEGEISPNGELQTLKEGAGFLAVEMRVPVVPVKLQGTEAIIPPGSRFPTFPKRTTVFVKFGKPLYFKPDAPINETRAAIEHTLRTL